MHARQPDAIDLVAAVRDSLQHLADKSDSGISYELRVAARALHMVERELREGDTAAAIEGEALRALHGAELPLPELRKAVCRALRNGALAADDPALLTALRCIAEQHLAIDNPDFAAGREAQQHDPGGGDG